MIFAAGLGTRLYPLTAERPKALVEVGGKPLLQWVIEKIATAGIHEIVVNVHHFPHLIRDFLERNHSFGMTIHVSDESDELLDTGGGLMHAAEFLRGREPVLIHNVDVLSNLDIKELVDYHLTRGGVATLAVRERETQRYLLFDREMRLTGWMNKKTGELRRSLPAVEERPLAFSGIHVADSRIFDLIARRGKFSLIEAYLELAATQPVYGFHDHSSLWMDVGKPEQLRQAGEFFFSGK